MGKFTEALKKVAQVRFTQKQPKDLLSLEKSAEIVIPQEEMNLRDLLEIIYRRKKFIQLFFFSVLGIVLIGTLLTPLTYQASSLILVELPEKSILPSDFPPIERPGWLETEVQIIKSAPVLTRTIETLNLDKDLRAKSLKTVSTPSQKLTERKLKDRALRQLEKKIKVSLQKQSNLIQISAEAKSPQLAADIANTLTSLYADNYFQLQKSQLEKNYQFVNEQAKLVRQELNQAEGFFQDLLKNENIASLEEELKTAAARIASLKADISATSVTLEELRILLKKPNQDFEMLSFILPEIKNDPYIVGLKTRLAALEGERTQLLSKYTPTSDMVTKSGREGEEIKAKIKEVTSKMVDATITQLESRQASLLSAINSYESKLISLNEKDLKMKRLTQEIEHKRVVYASMLKKSDDLRLSDAMGEKGIYNTKSIKVVSRAEPPFQPTKPKWSINFILACLIGSLGGAGSALFMEYLDDTIKDVRGIKKYLNAEPLGSVPFVSENKNLIKDKGHIFSNSFEAIWAKLNLHIKKYGLKSILITSLYSEGKSTVALHLALNIAKASDQKVLLVDANLRNPSIHYLLNLENHFGLREILNNGFQIEKAIRDTEVENLKIITSGNTTYENPLSILESEKLGNLLSDLRAKFDLVIIDSPALNRYLDGVILSSRADCTILLVEAMKTRYSVARYAQEMLDKNSARFLGVILNKRRYFIPEKVYQKL